MLLRSSLGEIKEKSEILKRKALKKWVKKKGSHSGLAFFF